MKKPKTADELFLIIREFFTQDNYEETSRAYGAFTGIRGPDKDTQWGLKEATTGVVRRILVGDNGHGGVTIVDNSDLVAQRHSVAGVAKGQLSYLGSDHFLYHQQRAFQALGLEWAKNNSRLVAKYLPVKTSAKKPNKAKETAKKRRK